MGLSVCKGFINDKSLELEFNQPEMTISEPDIISMEEFENCFPSKILNKMNNESIDNENQNNNVIKTKKINANIFENQKSIYYHGEFNENGLKDGIGKMVIITEDDKKYFYYGIWEKDKLNKGKIYYLDESVYDGQIKNYLREGNGTLTSEIETYKGNWKDDKKEGYGILINKYGLKYEGNFMNDKYNGNGKLSMKNFTYQGEFLNGFYHGEGFLEINNNQVYNGHFENGTFNGYGEYKWLDGINTEIYTGNYRNGKKDGKGTLRFKNGDKFEGNWQCGNPEGEGIYETKNRKYYGNWRKGLFLQLLEVEDKEGAEEEGLSLTFKTPVEYNDLRIMNPSLVSSLSNESTNIIYASIVKI